MKLKRKGTQIFSAACVMAAMSGQAYGLDIWHSNTVWANRGMCAAYFSLDSCLASDEIQNLRINLAAIDKKTNLVVAQDLITAEDFGRSHAWRYQTAFWESELACDPDLRIVITNAHATIAGVERNLLADGYLQVREFVPYRIDIDANFLNASERPQAC
ncbi:IrmA family protein [Paenalcaligenes hominis]|uniref:IrmA family protein n=1 Tax=Paenalcaligenes hominis TaxID=643674 RepID=UPI0035247D6E